ncbi:riboflavin synthase [Anatilimnocola floriformis]|uniref:riboflavin synthase n=1 Tax=Anatilimnocola floriformis TaxID=2948575 RepID=UPI0020C3F41D|nr:riboflavin synthase [Anatilimnocola floriformis]
MFTGLVEELGTITAVVPQGAAVELSLRAPLVASDAALGDSIAVNGCCLTVVRRDNDLLTFEAGSETLSRTNLGKLQPGSRVNLERSLKVGDRLGGHYVSGHIDGLGALDVRREEGPWAFLWFRLPRELSRQLAAKASIAVDGVSLTLVEVTNDSFSVALIPHTLAVTTLGALKPGDAVNLETDLLAKYVQRQLEFLKS